MFHVTSMKGGVQRPWVSSQSWTTTISEARIMKHQDSRIVCEPGCGHCDEAAEWNAAQEAKGAGATMCQAFPAIVVPA